MILLDTHIWVWWVADNTQLNARQIALLQRNEKLGLGVSVISCLEVAVLAEKQRLSLAMPVKDWVNDALAYPGIKLLELTPNVAVDSTQLPGSFHRDPADRIIVATARTHNCSLLTIDRKILSYPHVKIAL